MAEVKSNLFQQDPKRETSLRLFFVKESEFSLRWHIVDAKLGLDVGVFMALHGSPVRAVVTADTVAEMERKTRPGDELCDLCGRVYKKAEDVIAKRNGVKWR